MLDSKSGPCLFLLLMAPNVPCLWLHLSSLCLPLSHYLSCCLSTSFPPSYKDSYVHLIRIAFRVHPGTQVIQDKLLPLHPLFNHTSFFCRIRWYSEVTGIRTWMYFRGQHAAQCTPLHLTSCFCCCCSVIKSHPTLCESMDCSIWGSFILHCILELAQIHVHRVGNAI